MDSSAVRRNFGGGLIRSAAGWSAVKAMRRTKDHMKSDERILGYGEFVRVSQSISTQATKNFPIA